MQKECAANFIAPLNNGLFSELNLFKIIKNSIAVINDGLTLPEFDNVVEPWFKVFG